MIKPLSKCEAVIWASVAVMLVGAVITAVVQDGPSGAWGTVTTATIFIAIAGGERRRVQQQQRNQD